MVVVVVFTLMGIRNFTLLPLFFVCSCTERTEFLFHTLLRVALLPSDRDRRMTGTNIRLFLEFDMLLLLLLKSLYVTKSPIDRLAVHHSLIVV